MSMEEKRKTKLVAYDIMAMVDSIRIAADEAKVQIKLYVHLQGGTFPEPLQMLVPVYIDGYNTKDSGRNFNTVLLAITEAISRYGIYSAFEDRYNAVKSLHLNEYGAEIPEGLELRPEIIGYSHDTGCFEVELSFGHYKQKQNVHILHLNYLKTLVDYFSAWDLTKQMQIVMGISEINED